MLRNLLTTIAWDSQQSTLSPTYMGIHELRVGKQTHLLASNLEIGTSVAVFPAGATQFEQLVRFAIGTGNDRDINKVTVPAVPDIATVITERYAPARIDCSINSAHDHIANLVASSTQLWTRKGRSGSISNKQAKEIIRLRTTELTGEQRQLLHRGLEYREIFWMSFHEKEKLVELLREETTIPWFESIGPWFKSLPTESQIIFGPTMKWMHQLQKCSLPFSRDPLLDRFETNLRVLESLLNKPGKKFSAEMISVLLSAGIAITVPIQQKFGTKGTGRLWLKEDRKKDTYPRVTHAGVSLESLVGLLSTIW